MNIYKNFLPNDLFKKLKDTLMSGYFPWYYNDFINHKSKNKNKRIVILDIPLLLENKINIKKDILAFVESKKIDILKRLKKRKNFNKKLYKKFKDIQLSPSYKKKKSQFIIKNDFTNKSVKKSIKNILNQIT